MNTFAALLSLMCIAPVKAEENKRIAIGDAVPDVVLRTDKDEEIRLRDAIRQKPTVIIFYRGGWCPFCSTHLSALAKIEKDLIYSGFQLLAISPDQPAKLREKPEQQTLSYRLLSDSTMQAAKAFGIAFQVPDEVLAKYKDHGIDLGAASGMPHHLLPHPSVFIADRKGIIAYSHVNEDYKVRLDPVKVLEAAKGVLREDSR